MLGSQTDATFRGCSQLTQICCEYSYALTEKRIAQAKAKLFSRFVATLKFQYFNLFLKKMGIGGFNSLGSTLINSRGFKIPLTDIIKFRFL